MNRRETMLGLSTMMLAGSGPSQGTSGGPGKVQLYLLRDSKEPMTCSSKVKLIRGSLYGVPSTMKLEDVASTLGLQHISKTEELPYEANAKNVSSVPANIYRAKIRNDKTKSWMTNVNRTWRLELDKVPRRSAIQFHYGKNYAWSQGCIILVGTRTSDLMCTAGLDSPEEAVAALRNYVHAGNRTPAEVLIRIAFAT
jgi:hypothetical protein